MTTEKQKWWELLGWNDQQRAKQEQLALAAVDEHRVNRMIPSYFDPSCKHERCSYDILTCPKCIEYTKQKNEEYAKQSITTNVS